MAFGADMLALHNSFGYDSAFIGTTIARESFKRDFGINTDNSASISSDITSAFQAGALGGAVLCFFRQSFPCHRPSHDWVSDQLGQQLLKRSAVNGP
jgi:hypothetical protein